ncbi:MAG: LysM peptidoglycan-binding domain-containing protein [Phycisphaerales bacterium JB063]
MTRETKVGLVIGLGVILLVGIIVSEYFVRDDTLQDQPLAVGMSDFNNNSNQSALRHRAPDGTVVDPYAQLNTPPATAMSPGSEPAQQQAGTPATDGPGFRRGPQRIGADVALSHMPVGQQNGVGQATPPAQPGPVVEIGSGPTAGNHQARQPFTPDPRQHITQRPGGYRGTHHDDSTTLDTTQPLESLHAQQPPAPTTIEHVVAEGETLTQIARLYYHGDGNMWRSIRDANRDLIDDDGRVRAGTTIRIPKRSAEAHTDDAAPTPERRDVGESLAGQERAVAVRGRRVTVQEGDTLSAIASEHLGSATKWQLIIDANPEVLTNPNQLRPGMVLRIPAQEETDIAELANGALSPPAEQPPIRQGPTTSASETADAAPASSTRTYTVVSGDSLYRIAEKTMGSGSRYLELYEANKDQLDDQNDIREGMVLRIPSADP